MQILRYLLSTFVFGLAEAKLYGSLLPELTALLKGSTWKPQLNALFVGRDESELGKLLGTKKDLNIAPRQLSSIVRPEPFLKGKTNGGTGLWKDGNRYQSNYWGQTGGSGGPIKSLGGIGKRKKRSLPKSWDWRDNTKCQSLNDIRYQECGDCWAVASTSVMSDRYCLFTNQNKFFSARQVTTCVYPKEGGCDGGWPKDAMELYKSKGIASGGDPTIKDEPRGCLPYPYQLTSKSACPTSCDSKAALDVTKAGDYYEISSKNVNEIMQEIYDYGPVVSVMEIFDDFGYMGKGIYQHVSGKSKGFHSVRIVGYGEESGVPYWTVANSWGKDWGDMGYFKILRGKNHCGIESWITAVYPAESYKKAG